MKETNPQQKEGPLSKVKLFFSVWKQVMTMPPEEFTRLHMMNREARSFRKNMRTAFEEKIKHAKSYDEKLSIVAEARSALLDQWAERIKKVPREAQDFILSEFQELPDKAQAKFEKSGREKDRIQSQMYLRSAEVIRRTIHEQNQNQSL